MFISTQVKRVVKEALREDYGRVDITTLFTIPKNVKVKAILIAKEPGILCGIDVMRAVFRERDHSLAFKTTKKDGSQVVKDEVVATLSGDAQPILEAERVALNFLSLMSGTATLTSAFVAQVKGTNAKILDTRKTIPNLRMLQKYAVRVGGGRNHRTTLCEAILIKDNHLRAGKFIHKGKLNTEKITKTISCLNSLPNLKMEVEIETLPEFKQILPYKPDIIMLDNFTISDIRKAVKYRNKHYPRVKLEASGGVSLRTVRRIALAGVDFISIGALTHSAKALDFSLEIVDE